MTMDSPSVPNGTAAPAAAPPTKIGASSSSSTVDTPVLIVGGGPSGLLQAYMLSKLGGKPGRPLLKSLVIEKYHQRLAAPKAHALCPRTLEICRQFGLDTRALRAMGTARADGYWVNFLTNLSNDRIGSLPYERMDPDVLEDTPEMLHNIPQPDFEQYVSHQLQSDPNVEIRKGVAFVSCSQTKDGVLSTVESRDTKHHYVIRSRHVLACDGARSQVRKHLSIESEGEDGYETMMTIHFNADMRPVVKERVGMLHWITDPACSGFIIAYDISGNQVLISNFDSKKHPVESWNEDLCRKVVLAAFGQDVPLKILSHRPWVLSRKVAKQYRQGRVFLVGDAAHSFPPTGGLGLNSGLADVHNLAYKIAAVHQGWADDRLLDSYEADRRHMALVNSAQSIKNGKKIFSFLNALGVAGIDDVDEARANLFRSVHDPEKQEMIKREVEAQREHFDNLEIHIGYVYGTKDVPANASHYTPKFVPGARLPHAWIQYRPGKTPAGFVPIDVSYVTEWGPDDVAMRTASTLDLCGYDAFTLIAGPSGDWQPRLEALRASLSGKTIVLRLLAEGTDFDFVFDKHKTLFAQQGKLQDGSAILVRPDQHMIGIFGASSSTETVRSSILQHLGLA